MVRVRGRAYSQDLRSRVLAASDRGLSARQIASMFDVSISYAIKVRQRRDRTGEVRALKPRQVQVRRLAGFEDVLREQVARKIDATLLELCAWIGREHGVQIGRTALWRELRRLGLTLKKSRSGRRSRTGRTLPPPAWRGNQSNLSRQRLIFIDETWCSTNMARRYGRSPRGTKAVAAVPHGHWKISTFVAGLCADGIMAPFVFDCAMNGNIFRQYVRDMLAPLLRPGDVVVADNLAAHKVAGVREFIEARGATLLYLPAYSPDLNPIELVFAKLKHLLRSSATRTVAALWDSLGDCLLRFTPAECSRYIRHAGYGQTV
jgi:transposase